MYQGLYKKKAFIWCLVGQSFKLFKTDITVSPNDSRMRRAGRHRWNPAAGGLRAPTANREQESEGGKQVGGITRCTEKKEGGWSTLVYKAKSSRRFKSIGMSRSWTPTQSNMTHKQTDLFSEEAELHCEREERKSHGCRNPDIICTFLDGFMYFSDRICCCPKLRWSDLLSSQFLLAGLDLCIFW